MRKVFLDTNILVDFILQRPRFEFAKKIIEASIEGKITCGCSILTIANVAYICRKGQTTNSLKETLNAISELFEVLPMDAKQLKKSIQIECPDFEDCLQYNCAKSNDYAIIVTNNPKDFPFEDVTIITAEDYVKLL